MVERGVLRADCFEKLLSSPFRLAGVEGIKHYVRLYLAQYSVAVLRGLVYTRLTIPTSQKHEIREGASRPTEPFVADSKSP